jgi:hypothetical protein
MANYDEWNDTLRTRRTVVKLETEPVKLPVGNTMINDALRHAAGREPSETPKETQQ